MHENHRTWTCFVLAVLLVIFVGGTGGASGSETGGDAADRSELFRSFTADQLVGTPVTNRAWKHVARIEHVLIDPDDGRVSFVLLSFPETDALSAVPWKALQIDPRGGAHLVGSENELASAPKIVGAGRFRAGAVEDGGRSSGGWVAPERPRRIGDPRSFRRAPEGTTIVAGTVNGIIVAPVDGGERQVLAVVDTGVDTVLVELGPKERLSALGIDLQPGAGVTIEGRSRMEGGELVIEAVELVTGGETTRLRTRAGAE